MSIEPIVSTSGKLFFGDDDRCPSCGSLVLSDSHRSFIFYCSPKDIEYCEHTTAGISTEWRPRLDRPIPGDDGPDRVALWLQNKAVVQVHDGETESWWVPCSNYTVFREGRPYSIWLCRRDINGCDEDYMRSISS